MNQPVRHFGRSLGALLGLSLGFLLMWALGYRGVMPAFVFGAGGAVLGGIIGERFGGPPGINR